MKKTLFAALLICAMGCVAIAKTNTTASTSTMAKDNYAEITFDTLRVNMGTFSEANPEQKCSFVFTNTGNSNLVIHQAFASCGCTVPTYTKDPIKPGQQGKIDVTYNGKGKFPGHFTKTITVRSNARNEVVRLVIEGTMTEKK